MLGKDYRSIVQCRKASQVYVLLYTSKGVRHRNLVSVNTVTEEGGACLSSALHKSMVFLKIL